MYSKGSVALSNITASSNGSYDAGTDTYSGEGVHIDNTAGVAGITLTGTNVTNFNWTNGLDVGQQRRDFRSITSQQITMVISILSPIYKTMP